MSVPYRYDGSIKDVIQWIGREQIDRLRDQIRAAVATQLDHLNNGAHQRNAIAGAKATVFKEFAVLIRETISLDSMIVQAVNDKLASLEAAKKDALRNADREADLLKQLAAVMKAERDADPEQQRERRFMEMLNDAVPIPQHSGSSRDGTLLQALRSRGMALAAFRGLQCLGGFKQSEATEHTRTIDTLPI